MVFFEARDDSADGSFAAGFRRGAGGEETVQFGLGAHVAAEGFDGIVVESGLVERRLRLRGFGSENQLPAPSFQPLAQLRRSRGCLSLRNKLAARS
jgi:hypothetical protein